MKVATCLFCILTMICHGRAGAFSYPPEKNFLIQGKSILSEISPHKSDSFYLNLKKDQFASIRISQTKIGLLIFVYDPLDTLKQIVDENGIGQDEVVTIDASIPGDYKIKVIWNRNPPMSGKYKITLDKLEKTGGNLTLKAQQLFDSWYKKDAPGGGVVVLQNNQVVLKEIRGLANLEDNIPLSNSSVFEMASVSKQFTGLAVALLVDQKRISLDDDVRKYIPELPDYGEKITVGNLVYQTSGIRSTDALEIAGYSGEDILTLPMVVKFAANQKQLKFKPGEQFNYSNTNYNLLAEIVARVTKQSFSSWTKENIFKPLKMNATFFKEEPGYVYPHKVLCYKPTDQGYVQRNNNFAATGSAGLCTTIEDLINWVNSFDTNQLITKNMELLLSTPATLNDGSKSNYVFGNFLGTYRDFKSVEHLGLVIGYRTAIVRFPEKELAVIYLSNDDNDATYQRFYKIRDMFLGVKEQKPSVKGLSKVDEVLAKFEKRETVTATIDLNEYAGVYFSSELNSSLPLVIKNHKLVISHPRMNEIVLSHTKDDKFGFIQFVRASSGKITGLKILGENIDFTRVNALPAP